MINSDNLIQINIKFTFTIYEYIIVYIYMNYIKSQSCSTKKTVLNNLAKLIEKCFCWSLFLINLQAYKPATLLLC